jgi:hypothetical protein
VLLMKIKGSFKENLLIQNRTVQHEFNIGKFHLNSKLRFLTFNNEEPIKLFQKRMNY